LGQHQALAYSTDSGRTWAKFDGNPVLGHVIGGNRDPKIFWHEPTGRWVMVLYLDVNTFGLFASLDAKSWTELSRFDVPRNCECPDLFEMPVAGDTSRRKWVFLSGAGNWGEGDCAQYVIGDFDGTTFTPESEPIRIDEGAWNYSTQTWSDAPDSRRIFISWMSTPFGGSCVLPGNPFNGQYRVPWELSLVETPEGLRLSRRPVEELKTLRQAPLQLPTGELAAGAHAVSDLTTRSFDVECIIEPGEAGAIAFRSEGVELVCYDVASKMMRVLDRTHAWPLESDGTLALCILFDVNCVEVFAPDGLTVMSSVYSPETLEALDEAQPPLSVEIAGGPAQVKELAVYPMRSIW
jgi:sucrose-6-phosphate hydrolase SacC (GH32 family)